MYSEVQNEVQEVLKSRPDAKNSKLRTTAKCTIPSMKLVEELAASMDFPTAKIAKCGNACECIDTLLGLKDYHIVGLIGRGPFGIVFRLDSKEKSPCVIRLTRVVTGYNNVARRIGNDFWMHTQKGRFNYGLIMHEVARRTLSPDVNIPKIYAARLIGTGRKKIQVGMVVYDEVRNVETLDRALRFSTSSDREALVKKVANILKKIVDAGLVHCGATLQKFLTDGTDVWLTDWDRVMFVSWVSKKTEHMAHRNLAHHDVYTVLDGLLTFGDGALVRQFLEDMNPVRLDYQQFSSLDAKQLVKAIIIENQKTLFPANSRFWKKSVAALQKKLDEVCQVDLSTTLKFIKKPKFIPVTEFNKKN